MKEEAKRALLSLRSNEYGKIRSILEDQSLSIEELDVQIKAVTVDRLELAISFYKCAKKLSVEDEGECRSIISRCYYCCYHIARALIFLVNKDDFDDHSKLPKRLKECLRREDIGIADSLDSWREIRNEVEYSPFPGVRSLKETALEAMQAAEMFIKLVDSYFRERGVQIEDRI